MFEFQVNFVFIIFAFSKVLTFFTVEQTKEILEARLKYPFQPNHISREACKLSCTCFKLSKHQQPRVYLSHSN